ncbi:hypothetical protein [Micromonospora sp. C95]|uniref:effector-associated constant component EACC1 n=1 Tax=Micromonospora sp. C95 TaxID=2824882 RepID=UPI001B39062B|nr:hypothetical protein [Micromonospora sp. C95]MBQ1028365.1 hypothetical protein [Micromonospora sp. C95]
MRLSLTLTDDASGIEASSLASWYKRDPDVRRAAAITVRANQPDGAMGGLDVVDVVLTHAVAIPTLLMSFSAWRDSRRRPQELRISTGKGSVVIVDASPETIARVVKLLGSDADAPSGESAELAGQ